MIDYIWSDHLHSTDFFLCPFFPRADYYYWCWMVLCMSLWYFVVCQLNKYATKVQWSELQRCGYHADEPNWISSCLSLINYRLLRSISAYAPNQSQFWHIHYFPHFRLVHIMWIVYLSQCPRSPFVCTVYSQLKQCALKITLSMRNEDDTSSEMTKWCVGSICSFRKTQ